MHELKESQLLNLEKLLAVSGEFSNEAGIELLHHSIDKKTVVLESGHQPNFIPHAGLWKKMFLLDKLKKSYEYKGIKAVALFGFADYNLCTSKLLTFNKIPAYNKLGYEKFGFKIAEKDVWKRFDYLNKPDKNEWEKIIEKIASHYKRSPALPDAEVRLSELNRILDDCYLKARNLSDMNAFFISKISGKLALDINFFRYSDIQRKGIFIDQWDNIVLNLEKYNYIYNNSIKYHGLDMPLCANDSLPFWHHCLCGAKVQLLNNNGNATGQCRLCAAKYKISMDKLQENFKNMSPNAVARNVIFSEGMGTQIFVSGAGGGLTYGKISDDLCDKLGFNKPVTISWKSRDYYIGPAHTSALNELAKMCRIKKEDLSAADLNQVILDTKNEIKKKCSTARESGDKKEMKKYEGEYKNFGTSVAIIKSIFDTIPSFIDILVSLETEEIKHCWDQAQPDDGKEISIVKDVIYHTEAERMYIKISGISIPEND
ncbi:MAG: WbqC family protein [Candidatus Methanoperedens sp.]|nr:WbqC family protein [Candidatus Methanoperedens sp.]